MQKLSSLRPTAHLVPLSEVAEVCGAHGLTGGVSVTGVCVDSRDIVPGDLFVALPGSVNGWDFAQRAVQLGAVAVLTSDEGAARLEDLGVPVLACSDPRAVAGLAAAKVHPALAGTLLLGVTGTNGKSTTTRMLRAALENEDGHAGSIGTVGVELGGANLPSERTSLEAPLALQLIRFAAERGTTRLALEVSSHALVQSRTVGMRFDVVGFLNLQRDHLDYHGDMESYFDAKASLFTPEHARQAVVCVDDQWGRKLAQRTAGTMPLVTVSTTGEPADWQATDLTSRAGKVGLDFTLSGPGVRVACHCPIPGEHNVQNMALALVMAVHCGFDVAACAARIESDLNVPGRMEVVQARTETRPLVVVDYAHTTDALVEAQRALRAATPGRLLTVFGATGNRDTGKRQSMGDVVFDGSDVAIVTDDDPYDEPTDQIRAQVIGDHPSSAATNLDEARAATGMIEVAERGLAIDLALGLAQPSDTVLVAGRGHETIQMIRGKAHHLDDRAQVREYFERQSK